LLLFARLMVTAASGGDGHTDVAATDVPGVTGVVSATVTTAASVATGIASATAATTVAIIGVATTALSFSVVTFSLPVAMHLSRYGRLPSWNKSRTQCLVIFHSSTM